MIVLPVVQPVINQVRYPGAGDVDDCWVVATVWAATVADPNAPRPTIPEFRAAAGNPDDPGPDGGTLPQVIRGAAASWSYLTIAKYQSTDWGAFARRLADGWTASLAVIAAELPPNLRFGFSGAHQVGVVVRDGTWLVANPLAPQGSAPIPCPLDMLRQAARRFGGGYVFAALFKPWEAADVKFLIPNGAPSLGVATTTRETQLYRWDGARIPLRAGAPRKVYGQAVVDGKPVYVIRTGGAQEGHYLIAAHATFVAKVTDVKKTVTVTVSDGRPPVVITEV